MKRVTPRSPLDVLIMEQVSDGDPLDEVARNAVRYLAREKQLARTAIRSGVGYKTLSEFGRDEQRNLTYFNLECLMRSLGYRITLERL